MNLETATPAVTYMRTIPDQRKVQKAIEMYRTQKKMINDNKSFASTNEEEEITTMNDLDDVIEMFP